MQPRHVLLGLFGLAVVGASLRRPRKRRLVVIPHELIEPDGPEASAQAAPPGKADRQEEIPRYIDATPDPKEPYNPSAVRQKLAALDAAGAPIYISDHAVERMEKQKISDQALFKVLFNGSVQGDKTYFHKGFYRYRLVGYGQLAAIVAFGRSERGGPQDMIVVVTVFLRTKESR